MNFTSCPVPAQMCQILEPGPRRGSLCPSPGASFFRATQKAPWEGVGQKAQAWAAGDLLLGPIYPSALPHLCEEGTGQFSRIFYLGMAAGSHCVSGLWQRGREIVRSS